MTGLHHDAYLIGSLRNPEMPRVHKELEGHGLSVFSDWFAAGPEADDYWKRYEQSLGRSYSEALKGEAAQHVFHFDLEHLDASANVVLVLPAGRSGHLELGYSIGRGKRGHILLPAEDDRWDVMYNFALLSGGVVTKSISTLVQAMK